MTNIQEALKKLIEYVESTASFIPTEYDHIGIDVVNTGKAALADIEKCEPVAIVDDRLENRCNWYLSFENKLPDGTKLFTSPQPRDWVELTDEQAYKCISDNATTSQLDLVRDVEAKLKQLNTKVV